MPSSTTRFSVAMTGELDQRLRDHLDRRDGQEDICVATYAVSTGTTRRTALLTEVILPEDGEREVHGNASIRGSYVLRAARLAASRGEGIVILHSHPAAHGWQGLSGLDVDTESNFATLALQVTELPLVGMTLGTGDQSWSSRGWNSPRAPEWGESVRVVGHRLSVTWNDAKRAAPRSQASQQRTISAWGPKVQGALARLRVLVVGAGSVGLDVAQRLAAAGVQQVDVMDFDTVKTVNLDRLIGATRRDAALHRSKASVTTRLLRRAATANDFTSAGIETSVCEPDGLALALDYDVIFSCVDRPWARGVLNAVAHTDLIPVIDGGVSITPFANGNGMRGATFRTQVVRPGNPCLVCSGQVNMGELMKERSGALDDPKYIAGVGATAPGLTGENVSLISAGASASQLAQFVSYVLAPAGVGDPGPLRFNFVDHNLEQLHHTTDPNCAFEHADLGDGARANLTAEHKRARQEIAERAANRARFGVRLGEVRDRVVHALLGGDAA